MKKYVISHSLATYESRGESTDRQVRDRIRMVVL